MSKMPAGESGWNALRGVNVLDFTPLLPGPFATQMLADLGANVVKIEPLTGDFARTFPMELFRMANRNKRSLALNMKNPAAKAVLEKLVRWADVAVEAFRPGVAVRLGIDHASLRKINPRLIYCSVSGYGQDGPNRDVPGHDLNYLAAAGAMSFKGHWLDDRPYRCGLPVADLAGSSYAAISILSALLKRQRDGAGCFIDVSLADAAMGFVSSRRGFDVDDPGRVHLFPVNDLYQCADGKSIALGMVEEHFWRNFRNLLGKEQPALLDPRFDTEASRREHGDDVSRILHSLIRTKTAAEWEGLLAKHDIPVQTALTPREAAQSPQAKARGMFRVLDGETHLPFPVLVDGAPAGAAKHAAPDIGQHGVEVMQELGMSEAEIAALQKSGAVPPG